MQDGKILGTILLGLVAVVTGGIALVLAGQTLSGLGAGGLALVGLPVLILGGICAASVAAIVRMSLNGNGTDHEG
ncbi:hypothetical protein LCL97_15960 [Seohaeicola saemankumensis]|nr:hypothetical protein [Seohaeicola saemankumensis]MCA0872331.1 hypothetical protein [Seohaeicola saemankumensis]